MTDQTFSWPIRIYYESTDAGGVVYHAEYLKFFERARTECLRSLGFEQRELREREGVVFVVRSMQIKYVQPARFDEMLEVASKLVEVGRCRLVFEQKLLRGSDILTDATVEVVSVDSTSFKPVAIPALIREKMETP
ncbi:MAG: tol-pal system-associated acyl-CoA thioesterase [Nitrosomonadales bacterium]|nr:MAG: tol-pal system-associated acyl-CoA thioesterase [Nitrosomonadales bacterium]